MILDMHYRIFSHINFIVHEVQIRKVYVVVCNKKEFKKYYAKVKVSLITIRLNVVCERIQRSCCIYMGAQTRVSSVLIKFRKK